MYVGAVFATKLRRLYPSSLNTLDEAISNFPRFHCVPYRLAYFKNGVSDYVRSAVKSKKSMGMGTNGLGGMRFQDMPSMILQMMLSIGVLGTIIPTDYYDPHLGNLLECTLVAGFKLLDLYYNLSRRELSRTSHLPDLDVSCQGMKCT
jgi:hypothetical protein